MRTPVRKTTRIVGCFFIGVMLLWGTFWTVVVLNWRYHVLDLFRRESANLVKGEMIPSFDLLNGASGKKANSIELSWGKNLFVFINGNEQRLVQEILPAEGMDDPREGRDFKVFVIPLKNASTSSEFEKDRSELGYWRLTSELSWRYRLLPAVWCVENARWVDLREGVSSTEELQEKIRNFVNSRSMTRRSIPYSRETWSRILPPSEVSERAWSLDQVRQLFSRTFSRGSLPLRRVVLIWDQEDSSLVWQVELIDRVCDCGGSPADAFNLARVRIDPIDGQVVNLEILEAIPEHDFERIASRFP
jgi:hypothetical protein